jgi:hypothetical protein
MIHISWPFWTPELRRVIRKLKAEGKLREEPLLYLDKGIAKYIVIIIGFGYLPIVIWGHNSFHSNAMLLGICVAGLAIIVISTIKRVILPYTIGYPVNAYIVSPVQYGEKVIRTGKGWFFDYEIEDEKAPKKIQGKTFQANGIPKKTPELLSLAEGDRIVVMVHPSSPKKNFPYFSSRAFALRLTTDPVEIEVEMEENAPDRCSSPEGEDG